MTTLHEFGGGLGDSFWTLSCGLSQYHGHGSWLVCEVALNFSELRNPTSACERHRISVDKSTPGTV